MAPSWLRLTLGSGLLAVLGLSVVPTVAHAQAAPTTQPPADTGASVYSKVLRSTVWIFSDRGNGRYATGTGSLIDLGRRLVLTNYHVVGNVKKATVYFPIYERNKAIADKKYYTERRGRIGIEAEVVELDKQADLALLRLDRVPDGVPELALAKDSPDPGQTVHSIGNPGRSGALWVYTPGKVRQVYPKKWKAELEKNHVVTFEARVIETDSPTNPGDSGGPLVSDRGELVGVTQGGAVDAQLLSTFIDLSEVRRLLNRRSVQALRNVSTAAAPGASTREKPVPIKDEAKLFGEEAWKKAEAAAEKLFKEKKSDFVVETLASPPKDDEDKVKKMSSGDRLKYFRELVLKRLEADKVSGIYIIVCKSPSTLYVEMTRDAVAQYPKDFGKKLQETLLESFKAKKFDEGLTKAVDMALEARGLGSKK